MSYIVASQIPAAADIVALASCDGDNESAIRQFLAPLCALTCPPDETSLLVDDALIATLTTCLSTSCEERVSAAAEQCAADFEAALVAEIGANNGGIWSRLQSSASGSDWFYQYGQNISNAINVVLSAQGSGTSYTTDWQWWANRPDCGGPEVFDSGKSIAPPQIYVGANDVNAGPFCARAVVCFEFTCGNMTIRGFFEQAPTQFVDNGVGAMDLGPDVWVFAFNRDNSVGITEIAIKDDLSAEEQCVQQALTAATAIHCDAVPDGDECECLEEAMEILEEIEKYLCIEKPQSLIGSPTVRGCGC